jgi:4'-phosphopantetheinyl transferase
MFGWRTPRSTSAANGIRVCVAHLGELPVKRMLALLSAGECARAARIKHYEAWRQFVLTRGLLRMMLAHCTGAVPETFAIEDGGGEAPHLTHNPWELHFNVSHSNDCVAVAVGGEALGVDIERIDQAGDWSPLAWVCFHPEERAYLDALPRAERAEAFAEIWTRKEARIKATGEGFRADPSRFSTVPFDHPVRTESNKAPGANWYTRPTTAPAGYKVAIACNDRSSTIAMIEATSILEGLEQGLQAAAVKLEAKLAVGCQVAERLHAQPAALVERVSDDAHDEGNAHVPHCQRTGDQGHKALPLVLAEVA